MPSNHEVECLLPQSKARCRIADCGSSLAVIVTHPWGPLGGNMHNNVVTAAALYFRRLRVTTLRIDFQGSQISRGNSEVNQVTEAADFLLNGRYLHSGDMCSAAEKSSFAGVSVVSDTTDTNDTNDGSIGWNPRTGKARPTVRIDTDESRKRHRAPAAILLVGYSYGSLISASASADISRCVGCVSIAPPVAVKHWLLMFNAGHHVRRSMEREGLPRLMIMGSKDDFTSSKKFHEFVASFPADSTTGAELKDANHFFGGREKDLMSVIGTWLLGIYSSVIGNDLKRLGYADFSGYTSPSERDLRGTKSGDTKGTEGSVSVSSVVGSSVCACMSV